MLDPARALALLCLIAAAACGGGPAPPARGVVLVVVDTLRADHLGAYGYARGTSPRLDALAADATLFRNAVSPSPWTLPAVATLMTSLYPSLHGARAASDLSDLAWIVEPDGFRPVSGLAPSRTTLAELLRESGFATAAFVQGAYPSRPFGIAQGFDHFADNDSPGIRFQVLQALQWLDDERPERFFLYLHTIEVHAPYAPTESNLVLASRWPAGRADHFEAGIAQERERFERTDFDPGYAGPVDGSVEELAALAEAPAQVRQRDLSHLVALYDRGVAYTDHWIGALFDGLARRKLADDTVFVVTSDHGEEFREHGGFEHSYSYYDEMVRVPLILRAAQGRGLVVEEQVGLVDVMPTLLDLVGVKSDATLQGQSLEPLLRGRGIRDRAQFGEASMEPGLRAVRTNEWKYVRRADGREELYDLRADPAERANRCAPEPGRCEKMREKLREFDDETGELAAALDLPPAERAELDRDTRERLRALGYVED